MIGLVILSEKRDIVTSELKNLKIDPIILNEKRNNKGRWDYIPDKLAFPNEYSFIQKHFIQISWFEQSVGHREGYSGRVESITHRGYD